MSSSIDNYDDLNELIDEEDIDGGADAELFHQATTYVQSAAGSLDNTVLLKLYGYYKQAIEGPCTDAANRPSWYDFRAKAKYEAWYALGGMSKCDARAAYIATVQSLGRELTPSNRSKVSSKSEDHLRAGQKKEPPNSDGILDTTGVKNIGWVTHSTLQQHGINDDDDLAEDKVGNANTKTLLDLISSNNLSAVKELLANHPELITCTTGRDKLTPLHYAADRGSACVLEHILTLNNATAKQSYVDMRDSDGQTPLHYASTCGHADCCNVLLKHGATVEVTDNDGHSCLDVAADETIKTLLVTYRK